MKNTMSIGTVSASQMLKMDRAISREIEIQSGMRINHKRVVKSKKTYNRKAKFKQSYL